MHDFTRLHLAAACTMAGSPAFAHPVHSGVASSFAELVHLMTSPDHFFGTFVVAAIVLAVGVMVSVRLARGERRKDSAIPSSPRDR